jgi:hypothetical protein
MYKIEEVFGAYQDAYTYVLLHKRDLNDIFGFVQFTSFKIYILITYTGRMGGWGEKKASLEDFKVVASKRITSVKRHFLGVSRNENRKRHKHFNHCYCKSREG